MQSRVTGRKGPGSSMGSVWAEGDTIMMVICEKCRLTGEVRSIKGRLHECGGKLRRMTKDEQILLRLITGVSWRGAEKTRQEVAA